MKQIKRNTTIGLLALGVGLGFATSASAECGKVTIADMNWASAEFAAYLDKTILENGYGCEVEIVPGDTVPTATSMAEKGEPDIAPELWVGTIHELLEKATKSGKLQIAATVLSDGGEEGWWIPKYFHDKHPELNTVQDVLKRPDLFPSKEDPSRGAFMGCPAGWGCEINNRNLHKAFEMEKHGFDLIDPGSAAGLDGSIAKAYEREKAWFGYYWAPTAILGKYPMHKLDFGVPHDKDMWENCITSKDCENPKPTAWTESRVVTAVTTRFMEAGGIAKEYLEKRAYPNALLNGILSWMADEQATGEDGAIKFLKDHEDVWTKWVSADAASKIKAAL